MTEDLRPLVSRNSSNGVSRAEAHRDQIHAWFEELAAAAGVQIMLVKAPPHNASIWVAIEAWVPVGGDDFTRRSRAEIEIVPRDFCRWPVEIKLTFKETARTWTYAGIVDFTRDNAQEILHYLLGKMPDRQFHFSRCRVHPLAVWRPRNLPLGLKPDLLGRMPRVLWLLIAWPLLLLLLRSGRGRIFGGMTLGEVLVIQFVIGAAILGFAIWLLEIDLARAWRSLSGARPLNAAATPADTGSRDSQGAVALLLAFVGSFLVFLHGVFALLLIVIAVALWVACQRRARLVWSGGRPEADPRILVRMDSWQVLLIGLGRERDAVHDAVAAELRSTGEDSLNVADEKIWYWGVDGMVERVQTVVAMRSALAFMHFHVYADDLYVAWDAHVNRGTWIEKPVGRGIASATGALSDVHTIASGERKLSEYDVSDGNCVIERVHAVITRVVKRQLALHQLDQEIDFAIVREKRPGEDAAAAATEARRPRLPGFGLRRKA